VTVLKNVGIRALRTFTQAFLAAWIPSILGAATFAQLTALQALEFAAVAGVIAVVVNLAEEVKKVQYSRG
jgi:hypothetical protein